MINTNHFLKLGLIAMSKSIENGFWLHGHVGAEILTNTFFITELHPNTATKNAIVERIEYIINSKPEYINTEIAQLKSSNEDITAIETELENNIKKLSTAGHGVIFATLILKAIQQLEGWLPKEVENGILLLLQNTQNDFPERYYGFHDYQNRTIDISDIPEFKTPDEAAKYCMTHQTYYESQEIEGKFYHFHGKQIHIITHSNALVILQQMGYTSLVKTGLTELRKQIKLGLLSPPKVESYSSKTLFNPLEPEFWQRKVVDEHHNKLAYAVVYLLQKYPELDTDSILKKVSGHWELMK